MSQDPTTLGAMFEAGLKKVAPTVITGFALVGFVFLAWPDPTTTSKDYRPTDVGLGLVRELPDGGRAAFADVEVRAGEEVRLSADVPFAGTAKVFRLGAPEGEQLWPAGDAGAERTSAGRLVELGRVRVSGDAGAQTWLLSLCPLDAEAPACIVRDAAPLCPERCLTARLQARVVP